MTKTINISEVQNSVQTLIALTKNGDEILLEENGEPVLKITPLSKAAPSNDKIERKPRVAGLGKGTMWMSDDFDDELPDEFWAWDK